MINIDKDYIIKLRREIHMHPEVDFDLANTVAIVKRELDVLGIEYTQKYGEGSVVGYINPEKTNFTIAIRADMDALRICEKNDVAYRSKIDGMMHACGHDAHTAMLLGAAKALKEIENKIDCRIKLLFQPSEEGVKSGAMMMIENGVMDDVDIITGLHVEGMMDAGKLGVCKGYSQASSRNFKIEIFGKATHATSPHLGVDALSAAFRIYNDVQLMLSCDMDPMGKYVCAICKMEAGNSQNTIADYAMLQGTIRVFDMSLDNFIITRMEKIAKNVADEMGAEVKITAPLKSVSLYNNPYLSERLLEAVEKVAGKENIAKMPMKLGAEDFSRYLEKKPGVLFRLGTRNEAKGITALAHTDKFMIDEDALELGSRTFVQFVLDNMHGVDKTKLG